MENTTTQFQTSSGNLDIEKDVGDFRANISRTKKLLQDTISSLKSHETPMNMRTRQRYIRSNDTNEDDFRSYIKRISGRDYDKQGEYFKEMALDELKQSWAFWAFHKRKMLRIYYLDLIKNRLNSIMDSSIFLKINLRLCIFIFVVLFNSYCFLPESEHFLLNESNQSNEKLILLEKVMHYSVLIIPQALISLFVVLFFTQETINSFYLLKPKTPPPTFEEEEEDPFAVIDVSKKSFIELEMKNVFDLFFLSFLWILVGKILDFYFFDHLHYYISATILSFGYVYYMCNYLTLLETLTMISVATVGIYISSIALYFFPYHSFFITLFLCFIDILFSKKTKLT